MELENLNKLRAAFLDKLKEKYGHFEVWRHKDYEEISLLIYEKTKLKLSCSTLKRIFGNAHYGFSPSKSTLNALAQFLEYKNWDEFIELAPNKIPIEIELKKNKTRINLFIKILSVILLIVFLVFILMFYLRHKKPAVNIKFDTKTTIIKCPGAVEFTYDLSQIKSDSINIHFGKGINDPVDKLLKNSKSYIRNFLIPGINKVVIYDNEARYDSVQILILSRGWEKYLSCQTDKGTLFTYLNSDKSTNSIFSISKSEIEFSKIDSTGYYQSDYRYFDTLPLELDNFIIETRIRNIEYLKRFISCDYAALKIYSINSFIKINFTEPACIQNAFFFISDTELLGKRINLATLGIDLFRWHTIKLVVADYTATLFVDGIEIMKIPYTVSLGKFCGIQYNFSRIGAVDFVRLYNKNGILIYQSDF